MGYCVVKWTLNTCLRILLIKALLLQMYQFTGPTNLPTIAHAFILSILYTHKHGIAPNKSKKWIVLPSYVRILKYFGCTNVRIKNLKTSLFFPTQNYIFLENKICLYGFLAFGKAVGRKFFFLEGGWFRDLVHNLWIGNMKFTSLDR